MRLLLQLWRKVLTEGPIAEGSLPLFHFLRGGGLKELKTLGTLVQEIIFHWADRKDFHLYEKIRFERGHQALGIMDGRIYP